MNDHESSSRNTQDFLHFTETASIDQFERYCTFDLADPSIIDTIDIQIRTQDKEPLEKMRRALDNATQIIVCNTDSGLGDFIMSLRAIDTMGSLYPGKVICIPPNEIKDLLQSEHTRVVDSVDISAPGTVILNFGLENRYAHTQDRVAKALRTDTRRISDVLSLIEQSKYLIPLERVSVTQYAEKIEPKGEREHSVSDYYPFAIFKALGFSASEIESYRNAPLKEIEPFPTSYDVFLVPDAGHFPTENGYRSEKSPSLEYWDEFFFNAMTKGYTNIAISMGTSHAQYCEDLASNAEMRGFSVTRIRGSLEDMIKTAVSSRIIVTTDNGPAHILNEALLNPNQENRVQLMLELFSSFRVRSERFAIRGLGDKGLVAEYKNFL